MAKQKANYDEMTQIRVSKKTRNSIKNLARKMAIAKNSDVTMVSVTESVIEAGLSTMPK